MKRKNNLSGGAEKTGIDLLAEVSALSGLPQGVLFDELMKIIEKKQIDASHITVEQLREVVACYLREIMGELLTAKKDVPPSCH